MNGKRLTLAYLIFLGCCSSSEAQTSAGAPPSLFGPTHSPGPIQRTGADVPLTASNGILMPPAPNMPYPMAGATVLPGQDMVHQPGVAYSPWCGANPAGGDCGGPLGANGSVTYELYLNTGPSLIIGGGELAAILKSGWYVGGGARTSLFNQAHDAAWVFDLGLSYIRNDGQRLNRTTGILASAVKGGGVNDNFTFPVGIRGISRTSFNYSIGRDWYLNGPATAGEPGLGNFRVGMDVGGRWGSASIDLEPLNDPNGYRRRQGIYHAVFVASHFDWEKSFANYTLFMGTRLEAGHNWTNLLPPQDGNIYDLNILLSLGVRY